jgi:LacI family transcriptional regulator
VSAQAHRSVSAAAQRLGYQPNTIAQALRVESTFTVGMVVPQISNPFFPVLVEAIERALHDGGRELFLCDSQSSPSLERARIDALIGRQVDGLILVPCHAQESGTSLSRAQMYLPVVMLDRLVDGAECDFVGVDHAAGIRMAVEHLATLGRRHFAFVSAEPSASAARLRLESYARTVEAVDPSGARRVELGEFSADFGRTAAKRLIESDDPLDAIVCGADVVALGVISALHAAGRSVPDDIAVTGFDGIPYAEDASPGLTTAQQPFEAIGRECVRLLEERIAEPDGPPRSSTFIPSLIVRPSTVGYTSAHDVEPAVTSRLRARGRK